MCHHLADSTDWRELIEEAAADARDEEPPEVDLAEPPIGEHEIEEPDIEREPIERVELDD